MQGLPDQVSTFWWDMIVHLSKDHDEFALDVLCSCKRIVVLSLAERVTVHIRGEVADCCNDTRIQCTTVGEMTTETHAWYIESVLTLMFYP